MERVMHADLRKGRDKPSCSLCGGYPPHCCIVEKGTGKESASSFIDNALRAALPPDVPPSFTRIVSARWTGTGRKRVAEAELTMFDGQPAKVRVWRYGSYPDALAHTFHDLTGGDVSFEDGRWIRIDRTTLEPVSAQLEMFPDA